MKRKQASQEANDRIEEQTRNEVWSANCRYCGRLEKGTMEHMRDAAKRHGIGRCKELPNGA